jgi:hypothetical protein
VFIDVQSQSVRSCWRIVTADVEIIPIQKVNEAYARMLKSDVKYRFSIDMASLKSEQKFFDSQCAICN